MTGPTMHAEAEHTGRELLPEIVGRLLDRHDARRATRRQAWRDYTAAQRAFYERYERLAADIGRAAERGMEARAGRRADPGGRRYSTRLGLGR